MIKSGGYVPNPMVVLRRMPQSLNMLGRYPALDIHNGGRPSRTVDPHRSYRSFCTVPNHLFKKKSFLIHPYSRYFQIIPPATVDVYVLPIFYPRNPSVLFQNCSPSFLWWGKLVDADEWVDLWPRGSNRRQLLSTRGVGLSTACCHGEKITSKRNLDESPLSSIFFWFPDAFDTAFFFCLFICGMWAAEWVACCPFFEELERWTVWIQPFSSGDGKIICPLNVAMESEYPSISRWFTVTYLYIYIYM